MPEENTTEAPLGATPEIRETAWTGTKVLFADLSSYLSNRAPVERMRARGHAVWLRGDESQFDPTPNEYRLAPTSFGAPGYWDEVMVALGTAGREGWLHGWHAPRAPFISNGHVMLWVPGEVQRAAAKLGVNKELPRSSFEAFMEMNGNEAWDDGHDLTTLLAERRSYESFVRVGPSAIATRLFFTVLHLGGVRARACRTLGPVDVETIGIVMPIKVDEPGGEQ